MSQTRKKLRRLFQPPSTTEGQSFAARDLERPAREFDLDGEVIDAPPNAPAQTKHGLRGDAPAAPAQQPSPTRGSRSIAPSRREDVTRTEGDRHPITSATTALGGSEEPNNHRNLTSPEAVRKANNAARQTAPWAAANAFQSWSNNRTTDVSGSRPAVEKPAAAKPTQPSLGSDERPPAAAPRTGSSQPDRTDENASPNATRPPQVATTKSSAGRSVVDTSRHAVVQGRDSTKTTGPQAGREFAQWREQRANRAGELDAQSNAPQSTAPDARTGPQAPPQAPRPHADAEKLNRDEGPRERPVRNPNDASDRVQRRALLSAQGAPAPLSEKRKSTARRGEPSPSNPSSPRIAASEPTPATETHSEHAKQRSLSLKPRASAQATRLRPDQTANERLMWLIANAQQLSQEELVTHLRELGAAPLRRAHEARRLRLLASALLELELCEEALATLHMLHGILPHDSWVSLTLAETYARDVATWAEALHWCGETLRLHPWLSKATTLRDGLEERMARLN